MNQKEMLIKNIEDLGNELELQHPEYYAGYSTAINDVVELVKILNLHIVSNSETAVCVIHGCNNVKYKRGACREHYLKLYNTY